MEAMEKFMYEARGQALEWVDTMLETWDTTRDSAIQAARRASVALAWLIWYGAQLACIASIALLVGFVGYWILYNRTVPQPIYQYPLHFHTVKADPSELLGKPIQPWDMPKLEASDHWQNEQMHTNSVPCGSSADKSFLNSLLAYFAITRYIDGSHATRCDGSDNLEPVRGRYATAVCDFLNPSASQWTPGMMAEHDLSRVSATKRRRFTSLFGSETRLDMHDAAITPGYEYGLSLDLYYEYYPFVRRKEKAFSIIVDLISVQHDAATQQQQCGGAQQTCDSGDVACQQTSKVEYNVAPGLDHDAKVVASEQPQIGGVSKHVILARCQHEIFIDASIFTAVLQAFQQLFTGRSVRHSRLNCFEGYKEAVEYPMRGVRVVVTTPNVVMHPGEVFVYTNMAGLAYWLFHWFYTSAIVVIAIVAAMCFACSVGCCVGLRTLMAGSAGFGIPFPLRMQETGAQDSFRDSSRY